MDAGSNCAEVAAGPEARLRRLIEEQDIEAAPFSLGVSCHSVADAARAVDASASDFVKNICMIGADGQLLVAIAGGEDRASTSRVGQMLGIVRPRLVTAEEIERMTGYPCRGTPSFGFDARFLIDPRVMDKEMIYTGGGSETSLVRITPQEMRRANRGEIGRVRE